MRNFVLLAFICVSTLISGCGPKQVSQPASSAQADRLLQVDVYAWDVGKGGWETSPIATSDRGVFGNGKLWQHNLTLLAEKGSDRAANWKNNGPSLPPGKYLVKVYVDQRNRLAFDWNACLGEDDFVGQAEVESAWPEGYGRMTNLDVGAAGMSVSWAATARWPSWWWLSSTRRGDAQRRRAAVDGGALRTENLPPAAQLWRWAQFFTSTAQLPIHRRRPSRVVPRCAAAGCTSRCGRCGSRSRS